MDDDLEIKGTWEKNRDIKKQGMISIIHEWKLCISLQRFREGYNIVGSGKAVFIRQLWVCIHPTATQKKPNSGRT